MTSTATRRVKKIDPSATAVRSFSVTAPTAGESGEDPRICLPVRSGVSVGLRLASAISKAHTRDSAVSAITSLLAIETAGAVAGWNRSADALIFVAAQGLAAPARRSLIAAASPWPNGGERSLHSLTRTFASIAGSSEPTVLDLRVAVLLLAERCPEIEASRDELADAISALPEVDDVLVLDEAEIESTVMSIEKKAVAQLTPREREILELIASGLGTKGIADVLVISAKTVKTHVQNILAKLGVGSRLEAAAMFRGATSFSSASAIRRH